MPHLVGDDSVDGCSIHARGISIVSLLAKFPCWYPLEGTLTRVILIAVVLGFSQPALAQEATPAAAPVASVEVPNPWLAGALSLTTPTTLGLATLPAFGIGAPFGFGAGHVYAGDLTRGAWVSLGGLGVALAAGAYGLYGPNDDYRPRRLMIAGTNAAIATMVYSCWAAYDAYHTAERRQQPLLGGLVHE